MLRVPLKTIVKNPHRLAQKDTDALWTKKNNVSYFGYNNHVKQDKILRKLVISKSRKYSIN